LSSAKILRTGGSSDARNFGFFEIYGVPARTREEGVKPVRTFCKQEGGGHFFAILCGRLLWTAPNVTLLCLYNRATVCIFIIC